MTELLEAYHIIGVIQRYCPGITKAARELDAKRMAAYHTQSEETKLPPTYAELKEALARANRCITTALAILNYYEKPPGKLQFHADCSAHVEFMEKYLDAW